MRGILAMSLMGEIKSIITGKPVFDNAVFLKKDSKAKNELKYLEALIGK